MDSSSEFEETFEPEMDFEYLDKDHEDKESFPHGPWFLVLMIVIFLCVLVIGACS